MKTLPMLATTLFALGLGGCAYNDTRPQGPSSSRALQIQMSEMDLDRDGFLSRDEINPELKLSMDFARYDTNNDGRISGAEFTAYVNANTQ